jgi:hypothetical protein
MEEAIRFFRTYEVWVYFLLGFGGIVYIRRFVLAWQELRSAAFGLERDNAQGRLNQAASILVVLLAMAMMEFVLVSFVAPSLPGVMPLLTPTLDVLATPTITLAPASPTPEGMQLVVTETPIVQETVTSNGCVPGQVMIISPPQGSEIRGVVEILGTADIPNFGFYKLEMKRPEQANWLTILAGNEAVRESILGAWNTSLLPPANYQLSLVVVDNQGKSQPPCVIEIRVAPSEETPQP